MPFRFRKSIRLFPGVRVNLSKSGMSVSVGRPGATLNFSSRGTALTVGLPGTGLSFYHRVPNVRREAGLLDEPAAWPVPDPSALPAGTSPGDDHAFATGPLVGEIKSAHVATLTSPDLQGLKRLLNEAAKQKADLQPDLAAAQRSRLKAWRRLRRREQLPLRLFFKSSIPKARNAFVEAETETLKVIEAVAVSEVRVEFEFDDRARAAQDELVAAHDAVARSRKVWDVLSSVAIDRVRQRTTATNSITRTAVNLSRVSDGVIAGDQVGLRFQNANGADLDFFPGFLLVRQRAASDYALVDLREVRLEAHPTQFIEEEAVPIDAQVVGQTWAKANKDGSPDLRFKDNYPIPIARYGALHFTTPTGIAEAYHVSDAEAAQRFGRAFATLQAALRDLAHEGGPVVSKPDHEASPVELAARLPALPPVRGAHELTALAAAAVGAVCLYVATPSPIPAPPLALARPEVLSTPVPVTPPPVPGASVPSPSRDPGTAAQRSGAPGPTTEARPGPAPTPSLKPERQQMRLKQNANLRAAPDRAAASLRVVPVSTAVAVFGRSGSWVQVGDADPWGWIHGSVLAPQP